jgi:hypothetical protein
MRAYLQRFGGLSLAALCLSITSLSQAQQARPWIDPPLETGLSKSGSPAAPTTHEITPAATSLPSSSTHSATGTIENMKEKLSQEERSTSPIKSEKSSVQPTNNKSISEIKPHYPRRVVTTRTERSRQASQRRNLAEQSSRISREEQIRAGVNSGLEIMTLRTIEFPDGRRMQILTHPRPGTVSGLATAPE